MQFKTTNGLTSYLNKYDLINKYALKSIYNVPSVKGIIIELPLDALIKASDYNSSANSASIQAKAALIMYTLSGSLPFINFKKSATLKSSEKGFSLKIILTSEEEILEFLKTVFVEKRLKLSLNDFMLFKPKSTLFTNSLDSKKQISLGLKLPFDSLLEIGDSSLDLSVLSGFSTKELSIQVSFLLNNLNISNVNLRQVIRNLPFFWVLA